MLKLIAIVINYIGLIAANGFSTACMFFWLDEPTTPENLIK